MASHFRKVKQETVQGESFKWPWPSVNPGQETVNPAAQLQPLEGTRDGGSETCEKKTYVASAGADRPQTFQACAAVEPLKLDPDHLTQTSPTLGGDSPSICFTIPPTEEDIKKMQSGQDKNGYIKRPLNAFLVWAHIHRYVLQKALPGASVRNINVQLGCEWSKLSDKQKQPYYEVSQKLKDIHRQQFPDYEYRPKKKTHREAGQAAGQHQESIFSLFFSQKKETLPSVQPMLLGPSMYPCPPVVPYMGYNPYPCFLPYQSMGHYSGFQIHSSRLFYRYPNASSSMEVERNPHCIQLQRAQIAPASLSKETMQQEHYQSYGSHEVLAGSFTSENHKEPDVITNQQLSSNRNAHTEYEEDVDVVGLF